MDRRIASPLTRLEDEARVIDKSRLSSKSSESLATTGGLLDKLNLNDEDWNDPPDYSDHASYYEGDESLDGETNPNIAMFESLKSVLGSQRGHTQSAVNRVMELGKKVNTVEQSRPKVVKRSTVHSIHLDGLIQNEDDDDDDEDDCDGHNDHYDYDTDSDESTGTYQEEELSFIPQTPTRSLKTPTSSPRNLLTPRSQVGSTYQHKYSNSQAHSTNSNSSFGDCLPETFLYNRPSEETVFNGPYTRHAHTQSHDINSQSEVIYLNRSASAPIRKPSVKQSPTPSQELPSVPKPATPKTVPPPTRYGAPRQQHPHYPQNPLNPPHATSPQMHSNVPFQNRKHQYPRTHQQTYNQVYPHLNSAHAGDPETHYYQHPPASTPPMNRTFQPTTRYIPSPQTGYVQQFSPGNPYAPKLVSPRQQPQQQKQHWPAGINVSPKVQQQYRGGSSMSPHLAGQHLNYPTYNSQTQHYNNSSNNNNNNNNQRYVYPQLSGYNGAKSPNNRKPHTFHDVDLSNIIPR